MINEGNVALPFVAVSRVKDATIVAYHVDPGYVEKLQDGSDILEFLKLRIPELESGQQNSFKWRGGSIFCSMDPTGSFVCCAFASSAAYPEQLACRHLENMAVTFQAYDIASATEKSLSFQLADFMQKVGGCQTGVQTSSYAEDLGNSFLQRGSAGSVTMLAHDRTAKYKMICLFLFCLMVLVVLFFQCQVHW
eukprot:TRINITY_DN83282_c0_g1_i1.p1 TRINITY_DN83282_c0_g1~~TRINITY_DN83282_c0_g1_i1.p1  ORF type:complete len:193 (+),score=24.40 TRINITY_DN83282_c0_g1_i1:63-641(+)